MSLTVMMSPSRSLFVLSLVSLAFRLKFMVSASTEDHILLFRLNLTYYEASQTCLEHNSSLVSLEVAKRHELCIRNLLMESGRRYWRITSVTIGKTGPDCDKKCPYFKALKERRIMARSRYLPCCKKLHFMCHTDSPGTFDNTLMCPAPVTTVWGTYTSDLYRTTLSVNKHHIFNSKSRPVNVTRTVDVPLDRRRENSGASTVDRILLFGQKLSYYKANQTCAKHNSTMVSPDVAMKHAGCIGGFLLENSRDYWRLTNTTIGETEDCKQKCRFMKAFKHRRILARSRDRPCCKTLHFMCHTRYFDPEKQHNISVCPEPVTTAVDTDKEGNSHGNLTVISSSISQSGTRLGRVKTTMDVPFDITRGRSFALIDYILRGATIACILAALVVFSCALAALLTRKTLCRKKHAYHNPTYGRTEVSEQIKSDESGEYFKVDNCEYCEIRDIHDSERSHVQDGDCQQRDDIYNHLVRPVAHNDTIILQNDYWLSTFDTIPGKNTYLLTGVAYSRVTTRENTDDSALSRLHRKTIENLKLNYRASW